MMNFFTGGMFCDVNVFGQHPLALCVPTGWTPDPGQVHCLFCHSDLTDPYGAFTHTSDRVLKEIEIMQLLYKCGYWRATVLTQNDLGNCFFQVVFVNAIVQLPGPNAVLRMTPAWPIAPDVIQKSQPFFCMPQAILRDCIIKFGHFLE